MTLGIKRLDQPVTITHVYNDVVIARTSDQKTVLIENAERTILRRVENSTACISLWVEDLPRILMPRTKLHITTVKKISGCEPIAHKIGETCDTENRTLILGYIQDIDELNHKLTIKFPFMRRHFIANVDINDRKLDYAIHRAVIASVRNVTPLDVFHIYGYTLLKYVERRTLMVSTKTRLHNTSEGLLLDDYLDKATVWVSHKHLRMYGKPFTDHPPIDWQLVFQRHWLDVEYTNTVAYPYDPPYQVIRVHSLTGPNDEDDMPTNKTVTEQPSFEKCTIVMPPSPYAPSDKKPKRPKAVKRYTQAFGCPLPTVKQHCQPKVTLSADTKEMTIQLNKHNIYNTPDEMVIQLPKPIYDIHDPTTSDETKKNPIATRTESSDSDDRPFVYDDDPRDNDCEYPVDNETD